MIRKILGKTKRFFTQDVSINEDKSPDSKTLNKLINKASPTRQIRSLSNKQLAKSDETLHYLNMVKNGMTVKTGEHEALTRIFTGQKMYVDTRDISVAPHLMMEGHWENGITRVFQDTVKEGDTVLDIGANFGYFGVVAGSQVGRSGKVLLVEANKHLVPYIEKSLSVNGLDSFSDVYNVAIGDKEGKLKLNILEGYMGSSSVLESSDEILEKFHTRIDKSEEVRATSVDILCRENGIKKVDVIKIDIEGYEDVAYGGMKNTVKNSPKLKIFLEFTGGSYTKPKDFFNRLSKDFKYISYIKEDSGLVSVDSYERLEELSAGDWAMILLTNEL